MKPLDRRLLRHASSARTVLGVGGLLGVVRTLATLAWSWLLAQGLAVVLLPVLGGMGGGAGRVAEGAPGTERLPWIVGGALLALCARSAASWAMDVLAARGAVRVKSQLRRSALDAIDSRSPVREHGPSEAELATVLGRGLDALDGYFSAYLPQLILTGVATPLLVAAVLLADPVSGITVLIVFPIIPVFMVLIGLATQTVQDRQWEQLQRLSASFLDAVSGLATLKIFGREHRQSARIVRETDEYRSRTMQVLRVTFLSGFVLDLAGTFSIALVAVTVGTRLVNGEFPLALGLFVLLLLPETFIPIRQVGAAFHASSEGLAASSRVLDIIDSHGDASGRQRSRNEASVARASAPGGPELVLDRVVVERGGRPVSRPVTCSVSAGEVVALAGPSGAGKSTLLALLLGFLDPLSGDVRRPSALGWVGQRPGLLQGTIGENVALGCADGRGRPDLVRRSLDAVGLDALSSEQPLGALGAGVSGGQAQRIAIARCLHRVWALDAPVMLLDEPTSALDAASEARISALLRSEAAAGRAVLVVSHRQAVLDAADRVVHVEAADDTLDDRVVVGEETPS